MTDNDNAIDTVPYIWKIPAHPGPLHMNPIFNPSRYRVIAATTDPRAIRDLEGKGPEDFDGPDARLVLVEDVDVYCAGKFVFYNLSVGTYRRRKGWTMDQRRMVAEGLSQAARGDVSFANGYPRHDHYKLPMPPRNPILSDEQWAAVQAAYNGSAS